MKNNDLFICDEDNVFDQLAALYEDLQSVVYSNAAALDPSLEWDSVDTYEDKNISEDYSSYDVDFQIGDILLASVYQENHDKMNLKHLHRPFLVIYANARMAYGFQLSTSSPATLMKYVVEIPNYTDCGLKGPGKFILNMIRGVDHNRLIKRIGHITAEQRQAILNKLYEIRDNKNGVYNDCPLNDRLDITIKNVVRIYC